MELPIEFEEKASVREMVDVEASVRVLLPLGAVL